MKRPFAVLMFSLAVALLLWVAAPRPVVADTSHARIVRLSLVQGDVRFAPEYHKDSLTDDKAAWEVAPLNLPIRQGYALATDNNGRAEVEFENGAMAFLSANTLIEFYDLSLNDGAHITRLILRQGSAIFYVHPAKVAPEEAKPQIGASTATKESTTTTSTGGSAHTRECAHHSTRYRARAAQHHSAASSIRQPVSFLERNHLEQRPQFGASPGHSVGSPHASSSSSGHASGGYR